MPSTAATSLETSTQLCGLKSLPTTNETAAKHGWFVAMLLTKAG